MKFGGRYTGASVVAQTVKYPLAIQGTHVLSLGWEDPPEKEMATQSSILSWRIPWTGELGQAAFHVVAKSQTRLSMQTHTHTHTHTHGDCFVNIRTAISKPRRKT